MKYFKIREYYKKGIINPLYKEWQWKIILFIFNKLNLIEDTMYQQSLNL